MDTIVNGSTETRMKKLKRMRNLLQDLSDREREYVECRLHRVVVIVGQLIVLSLIIGSRCGYDCVWFN